MLPQVCNVLEPAFESSEQYSQTENKEDRNLTVGHSASGFVELKFNWTP